MVAGEESRADRDNADASVAHCEKLLKRRGSFSGGMPGPVSVTSIRTVIALEPTFCLYEHDVWMLPATQNFVEFDKRFSTTCEGEKRE